MKTSILIIMAVALLSGCENTNQIASILNDVEVGVESIDVKSTDPVNISVGLHIREESEITLPEAGTLADRLLGEWVDSDPEVDTGFAFYADNTFGFLAKTEDGGWLEIKFAGTYILVGSHLDITFNDNSTWLFRIVIRGNRMSMTNRLDDTLTRLTRLR